LQRRKILEFALSLMVMWLALAAFETLHGPKDPKLLARFFHHLLSMGAAGIPAAVIIWFGQRWRLWGLTLASLLCVSSAAIVITLLLLHKLLMGLLGILYVLIFFAIAIEEFRKLRGPRPQCS
jgi:hypothetical protein